MQKQLSLAAAIELLAAEPVGHLATCTPDQTPYITPLHFVYYENRIYFHCAHEGHKLDNIRANPHVCLAVNRIDKLVFSEQACRCATRYHSVLVFGQARILTDLPRKAAALNALTAKYAAGRTFLPVTPEAAAGCCVVEICIDRIEGKCNVDPQL